MNKLYRIISFILVLASLVSVFTVFVAADAQTGTAPLSEEEPSEENGEETDEPAFDISSIDLIYKRDFGEGWDYNNPFTKVTNHKSYIDYEETVTRKYNYFWRMEATTVASAGTTHLTMTDAIRNNGTVFHLKLKADDACDLGRIMYLTTAGGDAINLLYISGNTLYAFQSGSTAYKIGELTNEWITIDMVFDWDATTVRDDGSTTTLFKSRVYYGDNGNYFDYQASYPTVGDVGWRSLYFAIPQSSKDREGMSYCIDDLWIYNRSKEPIDLSEVDSYGSLVNFLDDIVIDIQDGPGKKSREQIIEEALCMKVRVDTALMNNKKVNISDKYCAPEIVDGHVMVPLDLLISYMGFGDPLINGPSYSIMTGTSATYITIGRNKARVGENDVTLSVAPAYLDGHAVIAAEDISTLFPGWYMNYDDMGLVVIYNGDGMNTDEPLLTREKDLETMLAIMKEFVFDIVTTDKNGNEFEQIEDSYTATGSAIIADLEKNGANHPYLLVDQKKFDDLSSAYVSSGADAKLKEYINTLIGEADAVVSEYALANPNGTYSLNPEKAPVNPYNDGKSPDPANPEDTTVSDTTDGYDPKGKLESINTYSEILVKLAFAYQITKDEKYADLAYDMSIALGKWSHWGPSDMANCATATGNFAIAYDWLYNYYMTKADGEARVNNLVYILYNKGVKHGYNASFGLPCESPKTGGGGDVYHSTNTYVNVVASANMIIGALVLSQYDEYKTVSIDLIGNNLQNLIANGLDKYAPDGSFAESAPIWESATNSFMKLIMAFESATGTTYGFEDTWGIDKTFYFAYYIEDSDGNIWNYHEGGPDGVISEAPLLSLDTYMFGYAAQFLKDPTLIAIRQDQIEKGKAISMFDVLFYSNEDASYENNLALDYHMEGIHAFVSRSDWNEGALYTGIMGGSNSIDGAQLDSGNFIYRNKGINWIIDLGSDNEEIYSYYGTYRFHHYRHNAEGQNVVIINTAQDTIPYGQLESGNGVITSTYMNEYGSYAILNNKTAYGSSVTYAYRGLYVTNDRETVVVQDEISFKRFQEVYWIAHTASEIYLDNGDKVAYLVNTDENGNQYTLRATLISRSNITFKKEENTTTATKLAATYKDADYKSNGGIYPNSRTGIKRLVISEKNALTFEVAVVFELVDGVGSSQATGYTWTDMSSWIPYESLETTDDMLVQRDKPVKEDIVDGVAYLNSYVEGGYAYSRDIAEFYSTLTSVAYIVNTFTEANLDTTTLQEKYGVYKSHLATYNRYLTRINGSVESNRNLAAILSGMPK